MKPATFQIQKQVNDGKVTIILVVRNANASLRETLETLGYKADCSIANHRSIKCTTPEEVDSARKPIMHLFDRNGNWIG